MDPALLRAGIDAIDACNAQDPNVLVVDGVGRPKELVHAERMSRWLVVLDPAADPAQQLAARGHHLRRWVSPRSSFPDGRAGYLRWRTEHKKRQAAELGDLLAEVGVPADEIERVRAIVAKQGLGTDPAAQTHEDALCLVFLESQFDELTDKLGDEHMVEVVRRTARKMSPRALELAGTLPFSAHGAEVLARALATD